MISATVSSFIIRILAPEILIINPMMNVIVAGEKYDLSAEDVIDFCKKMGGPGATWRRSAGRAEAESHLGASPPQEHGV